MSTNRDIMFILSLLFAGIPPANAAVLQEIPIAPIVTTAPAAPTPAATTAPATAPTTDPTQATSNAFANFYKATNPATPAGTTPESATTGTPAAAPSDNKPAAPALPNKNEAAFGNLLDSALPLSPEQIKQLHHFYDLTQQAVAAPPNAPPTPVSSSLPVTLDPGSTPPLIRLSAGFVSSLVFVDSTGAPWPITAYGLGDPSSFNVQWDQSSNALFIQSLKPYAHGNLAVRLATLNTPVMISLVAGQKEIDYRVDLQMRERGPNAAPPIVPGSLNPGAQINPKLLNVLDGVAPIDSKQLTLSPDVGQAWLSKENKLYLRTTLTLLSPAWSATISSPNGTHVYEMAKTPMVLASQDGKTITVEIKGL